MTAQEQKVTIPLSMKLVKFVASASSIISVIIVLIGIDALFKGDQFGFEVLSAGFLLLVLTLILFTLSRIWETLWHTRW